MKTIKMVIIILITIIFLFFAFQNNIPVDIRFFRWTVASNMPLFIVLVAVFLMGFIWGRISAWFASLFNGKKTLKIKQEKKG